MRDKLPFLPAKYRRRLKNKLLNDNNFTCKYCGKKLIYKEATLDHVIPVSRGGKTVIGNLAICCKKCNTEKGNQLFSDFGASHEQCSPATSHNLIGP